MRRCRTSIFGALLGIALVGGVSAGEPAGVASKLYPLRMLTCPDALLRACCDTYCPKPRPWIPAYCRGGCRDTYRRKPCPNIPCFCSGCGEAYCAKPCPPVCRPIAADYFSCAAGDARCGGMSASYVGANSLASPSIAADSPGATSGLPFLSTQDGAE